MGIFQNGKNLLKNTATSQTINGVTFTVNEDGSVTANGTASALTVFYLCQDSTLPAGKYVAGKIDGDGGMNKYRMDFGSVTLQAYATIIDGIGRGLTFSSDVDDFYCAILIYENVTVSNLTFYPMIRLASIEDDTYEPYCSGKSKLFAGDKKVKKAYLGTEKIYSAGNIVTYCVDNGVTYQEEVDSDASCLNPTTFTPSKSGWTFVGWREDTTASSSVLSGKIMGDEPITLYAVFKQAITLTYYNNSTTKATKSGNRYYNNGNIANPTFTLSQASKSGWTARGWATGTAGNAIVAYSSINGTAFSANTTIYGLYYKTIIQRFIHADRATANSENVYYNSSGDTTYPYITMPTVEAKDGWAAIGWTDNNPAASASADYSSGQTGVRVTIDENYFYAVYQQQVTITFKSYNSTQYASGYRYYNAYGNLVDATITAPSGASYSGWSWRGWTWTTDANASVNWANGDGIGCSNSTTVYGLYYKTVYLYYNGNGSTSGSVSTQSGTRHWNAYGNTSNPSFTLASNGYSRTNGTFLAWASGSASGTQYSPGASVTLSSSTTFYAKWSVTSAVTFDLWRGSAQGDETLTRTITSSYVSNVSVVGRLRSNSTDGNNNGDGRCDVTLYINDTQIGFVSTHDEDTTVDINRTNLGAFSGVTIKMLVHPHSWNWGEGLFSGTVTTTTIV